MIGLSTMIGQIFSSISNVSLFSPYASLKGLVITGSSSETKALASKDVSVSGRPLMLKQEFPDIDLHKHLLVWIS